MNMQILEKILDHVNIVQVMGLHQRRKSRQIWLYFQKSQDYLILSSIILFVQIIFSISQFNIQFL